jgi:hypothetical protein
MKPKSSVAAALALVLPSVSAAEPEVRLVQYQVGAALSDEVPFEVKPMGHQYGAILELLVSGEDLVAFREDSLEITALNSRDGEPLVSGRGPGWKETSFPKVGEDGTVAKFGIEIAGDLMGRIEGAEVKGSIGMQTASEEESVRETLKVGGPAKSFGDLEVKLARRKGFGGGPPSLGVVVVGDYAAVIEVTVEADGENLESRGSSWSGDTKTFDFGEQDLDEAEVEIRFWSDVADIEVPFEIVVGAK